VLADIGASCAPTTHKVQLMSTMQTLPRNTLRQRASKQPDPSGRPATDRRRRTVEVTAGIGLLAMWALAGPLLRLDFVVVLLLGVLLLAAFQTLVRRRPMRTLLLRDTASFAHGWTGKLLVTAVLVAIPQPWC
jgi:hypothetical protein